MFQNAPLAALPPWSFLDHFVFKFDPKCSSGCPASSSGRLLFSFSSNLLQNDFLDASAPSCVGSLFNSSSNLMQNALLAASPPLVVVSYSILIQNGCKILIWLPRLLLGRFLIQFLFKIDTKCSSGCIACSCGGFLYNSYSELMQNVFLATWPPHPVLSSVLNSFQF